ncbi:NADH dehydrogenase (ubiquinone) complex I, assembly factor 6 [Tribolium castaneum]|uniref:NADH dehydrogenase (Ubiquinone) complex I, assembly factor 6 homolog-like Protein n=1 Tax=Tribolium castaneum TaxID=7070 RepID=D6WN19_TRICA|nr:PREDICTED: NADH dehydrogenase (ubiquinone) complex I, assembly factor 6 [Tribolium castaneum]EFA03248.1 NADH dehydrogenase (ubiquinone) complex I, assembly factor 6 homolog-like Protein [Tribolium castaneum]|eukprot:XP_971029.1 PREDICTED: NADH dehydrogenase (ubiquinone) complex I, assembly factor 6 [Tribolium castaneum]
MNLLKQIRMTRKNIGVRNSSSQTTANYCMNLVKSYDYENFLSTLLLKGKSRSCAFAVRSFNVEVARVAEQVSTKETGLMRMQFWEDALEKCFSGNCDKVPRHPVAIELFNAISRNKLSKRHLKNLILSRKEHFNLNTFHKLEDMETYSERSVSSVYYLILEGCDIRNINADHAASHLGKAQGIVQNLRCIPQCKNLNFVPLPQSILVKNNVSQEELLRHKSSQPLSDCVYEVATRAHQHLMKARSLQEKVPPEGRSVLLPAVATFAFLKRLENVNYDIFHPQLKARPWNLLFKMWFSNFKNKY